MSAVRNASPTVGPVSGGAVAAACRGVDGTAGVPSGVRPSSSGVSFEKSAAGRPAASTMAAATMAAARHPQVAMATARMGTTINPPKAVPTWSSAMAVALYRSNQLLMMAEEAL